MGLVYANIELSNPVKAGNSKLSVKSWVDTGALHLCIPEHIAIQLGIEKLEDREVTLADGTRKLIPYGYYK